MDICCEEPSRKRKVSQRMTCHDFHDDCMNTIYKCCLCMDKRPIEDSYRRYVDGVGEVFDAKRYEFYCSSCKTNLGKIHNTDKVRRVTPNNNINGFIVRGFPPTLRLASTIIRSSQNKN